MNAIRTFPVHDDICRAIARVAGDTSLEAALTAAFALLVARHTSIGNTVKLGAHGGGEECDPSFLDVLGAAGDDLPTFQSVIADAGLTIAWRERPADDASATMEIATSGTAFGDDDLAALIDQFPLLLAQLAESPDVPVSACSLVTPAAAACLPDPAVPLPREQFERPADTFLACARRLPEAIAVCERGGTWTYAALANRVGAIARQIDEVALPQGSVVAVTGPRSAQLVAAIMAVLSGPHVLLTLDPTLPRERRRAMLERASARAVLFTGGDPTDADWLASLGLAVLWTTNDSGPTTNDSRPTTNDSRPTTNDSGPTTNDSGPTTEDQRPTTNDHAYIFFTSGTSGVPKTVLGSHNSLGQFLAWQRATFGIGPGDRCAQLISLSFDAVLRDILLPLTSGAALHVPDETEDATSGGTLAWLKRERITVIHTVPSLAASWLAQADLSPGPDALRWVFFAGEPLSGGLVAKWRAAFPGDGTACGRLVNFYGPTETTFIKCWFLVPAVAAPGTQPIGAAMPGAQALVLGPGDRLCGVGEPGEIAIRTPYGTYGYLGASSEQHARFGTNPFGTDRGDVIYRTGDRGRYRPDGSLEILGRFDDEVKVRGVRVSPAEVAAAIMQHPGVRQAAVAGERDERNETCLAAYVVPTADAFSVSDLRADLARRLPPALIPSRFAVLDRLPLLPNGKVDAAALPRGEARPARADEDVQPRTALEREVADEWCAVLSLERAGVDDDFFALGGHSLLAAQLLARLRVRFGVQVPLRGIFENPTIAALAALIDRSARTGAETRA